MSIRKLLVAVLAATQVGCASLYTTFVEPGGGGIVYGGTRLNCRIIGSAVTGGDIPCGLRNCDQTKVWLLVPLALPDVILSAATDTLMLPVTLSKE
jgi:uncharacterized protein YceK